MVIKYSTKFREKIDDFKRDEINAATQIARSLCFQVNYSLIEKSPPEIKDKLLSNILSNNYDFYLQAAAMERYLERSLKEEVKFFVYSALDKLI